MKQRILFNMMSQNAARIVEVALGFVIVPLLLSRLGLAPYGLIVLAESVIAFFDVGISGLRHALGRYVGFHLARGSSEDANGYLGTGAVMLNAVMLASAAAGAVIVCFFDRIFRVPAELAVETRWFFALLLASFLVEIGFTKRWVVIYAQQRFDLLNAFSTLRNIIRFALVLAVYLPFEGRLVYYGWIFLAATVIERLFISGAARKLFPAYSDRGPFTIARARELGAFMAYRTIQSMSGTLYGNSDMLLINWFLGPQANAIYAVSTKIVNVLRRFVSQTMWVLTPSFTELLATGRTDDMRKLYLVMVKLSAIVTLPVCIGIGVFAPEFITLWVGTEYLEACAPLYFHLVAMTPSLVFAVTGGLLTAYAKIRLPSFVAVTVAVLRLGLAAFLGVGMGLGLVGFALASALVAVPQYMGFLVVYACRIAGIPIGRFFADTVARPLALAAAFGAAAYALKSAAGPNPAALVAGVAALGAVYAALTFVWVLAPSERSAIRDARAWVANKARKSGDVAD